MTKRGASQKTARRRTSAARATTKAAGKKTAPKRPSAVARASKVAPKRAKATPKRASAARASTPAPKRAAAKSTARGSKPAPKRAAKTSARGAAPKPARRPARALKSARRAPRPPAAPLTLVPKAAPTSFPQTADGSAKQRLMFELLRARTSVLAALHGLGAASGEERLATGRWSIRELVLHLVARDRVRLRDMEAALTGRQPDWFGHDAATHARTNEDDLAPLRAHTWDDALRLLQTTRRQLMEAIEAVPDEPAQRWTVEHPFGEMLWKLPVHDRHHADQIKRWRTERGA